MTCTGIIQHIERVCTIFTCFGSLSIGREDTRSLIAELATTLSDSEHRVLDLILNGFSTAEIAELLGVKAATISQTRSRIIEKMKKQTDNAL